MAREHTSRVAAAMSCQITYEKPFNIVKAFKIENLCSLNFLCDRHHSLAFFYRVKKKNMKTSRRKIRKRIKRLTAGTDAS